MIGRAFPASDWAPSWQRIKIGSEAESAVEATSAGNRSQLGKGRFSGFALFSVIERHQRLIRRGAKGEEICLENGMR